MASIDGLVSGLDTTTIISQLMQLERQPQSRLKTKQATVESAIGALRNLNTKFLAVTGAAGKLTDPKGWALATATSSDATRVAVTATAGAAQGTLSLKVGQLATAASYLSEKAVGSLATVVAPEKTTLHIRRGDGTTTEVSTGDGSLAAVMKAINTSSAGVTATAVQVTAGQYRLKLESTTSGARSTFTIGVTPGQDDGLFGGPLGSKDPLVAAKGAQLSMDGVPIERESNTIADLLPGVTLTLLKPDAPTDPATTIGVKADPERVAAQVQSLVDAVNAVTSDIKALTNYDLDSGSKGKLYGDGAVRSLRDRLTGSVTGPGTAAAGISIDRNGVVTFDKAAFLDALAADPVAVEKALGTGTPAVPASPGVPAVPAVPGLVGRLHAVADGASRSATAEGGAGLISSAISSRESQVRTIKSGITSWDNRLEQREATLKRQYAALEKALGASQSQGQWLAGQIAGLPSWS